MRKLCLIISLFWGSKIFAQVNLQTGSATFSLPMFNWQDNKSRLSSTVELEYNSGSGLKVNDVASNVGQGWNLLQGGVISRMQVGEPDDQKAYVNSSPEQVEDIKKFPDGFLYASTPFFQSPGCPTSLTKYPIFKDKNHLYKQHNIVAEDRELDYFSFSFNGRTAMFVLNKNGFDNVTCNGVLIGDSKLKVWCTMSDMKSQQIRTTIDIFYVQDENGLIYKFAQHNLTQVLKTQYSDHNLNATYTQPQFKSGKVYHESSFDDASIPYRYIISGWYLSEIKDPLTQRVITFNYNNIENIHADAGASISYYEQKNYSIISHSFSYSKSPKITFINYPDGHQVLFNYGAERIDMKGDKILSSIDIVYKSRYISKYILNTTYVILNRYGNPVSDFQKSSARLYLRSVKKMGVDLKEEDPPYIFDYFLGSSAGDDFVPPPFFHAKDIWGFYNGNNSKAVNGIDLINLKTPLSGLKNVELKGLCFLRDGSPGIILNPKPGYAKNGLLRQITYPTGGSLNYDYDQNRTFDGSQNTVTGGVHVLKTTVTDGGYANNCNNPIVTSYNYTLDDNNSQSSLWGVASPVNSQTLSNHYKPEPRKVKLKFPYTPLNITCYFKYEYPGILSRDNVTSLMTGQEILAIVAKLAGIVGTVSEIIDVIQFAAGATGPAAVIIDFITTVFKIYMECFADPSKDNTMTIFYNSDLNAGNSLPSQFKRVEVIDNSGSNGKTVYEFTSSDQYPVWEPTNPSFSMKQRFGYWEYGLPKKITVKDALGNKVRETENFYDPTNIKYKLYFKGSIPLIQCTKCLVTASSSQISPDWADPNKYNAPDGSSIIYQDKNEDNEKMLVDAYGIYTGRLPLQSTHERIYKQGDDTKFSETIKEYEYNPDNYQVSAITTTLSNGDKDYKTIRYDNTLLTSNNIINTPFETTSSYLRKNETTRYYTGESVTEYTTLVNGNIVPSRTLVQRFAEPRPSGSMLFYDNYPSNPPYQETQAFTYDANGNLTGIKDEGNHIVTNIYGYDDKYVVSSVINADPDLDKPAYTSFETTDFTRSGWTMNGADIYSSTAAITGSKSLILSSGKSLTATLNSAKSYKLSFWATTSGINVANGTLIKSVPSYNGFTYYEYKIAQGSLAVTVSGSANIDELRLYPQNARMKTVTYDPLIGKTSECDENNRITYYKYDALARMRFIMDESRNVVKMYEYNVKNNNNPCGVVYHNLAVSEVFTKNNCAEGYVGSEVTYTIPDSKYTSTVSPQEVDQQLQAELDANGQAYANANGTCIKLFYNAAKSQTFTKEACDVGLKGTTITYSVPYGKFTSIIDQLDADEQAQEYIDANGQAFANAPGNAACVIDYDPDWEAEETAPKQCQMVNGMYNSHQMVLLTDVNPYSPSYNQTQWADIGQNLAACPATHGYAPILHGTGYQSASGSGFIAAAPGTQVTVVVKLHSSDAGATLSGFVGVNVQLSGSGNQSVSKVVTIPATGYINWNLNLNGNMGVGGGYISAEIVF